MTKCQNTILAEELEKFLKGFAYKPMEEAEANEVDEKALEWGARFEGLKKGEKSSE